MFEGCPPERSGRPRSHRLEGVGNGVHRWMITGPHGVTEPGLQGWLVPIYSRMIKFSASVFHRQF